MRNDLRGKITAGKFVITVEMDPPKSANPLAVFEKIKPLVPLVDAVNIADSPMAKMRMSPIALASLVQTQLDLEAIFHLTCRDRNLLGLQSELLGAYALGVKNILVLTGDKPEQGDHPLASGVFDLDSVGLASLAKCLSAGKDFAGNSLDEPADFFTGAVVNPTADDLKSEIEKMHAKIENGVNFFQTQPIFEIQQLYRFLEAVKEPPAPILYGIMPLKSLKLANYLNEKVPGVNVPQKLIQRLQDNGREGGLQIAGELLRDINKIVPGIHIFPMGDVSLVVELLKEFKTNDNCA